MKRGHVCLRSVLNILVISLGVTAEHTHPCDDKQRGLSCPLRIRHKHQSDQPHFARGSLHLLVNESNKCANVVKNSLLFQSVLTASPQGLSPVPRGRCKISLNHLIFFFILTVTITNVTEEKSWALPEALERIFVVSVAKDVDNSLIFCIFPPTIFMNINVSWWWGLFAVVSGLDGKTKVQQAFRAVHSLK